MAWATTLFGRFIKQWCWLSWCTPHQHGGGSRLLQTGSRLMHSSVVEFDLDYTTPVIQYPRNWLKMQMIFYSAEYWPMNITFSNRFYLIKDGSCVAALTVTWLVGLNRFLVAALIRETQLMDSHQGHSRHGWTPSGVPSSSTTPAGSSRSFPAIPASSAICRCLQVRLLSKNHPGL